MTWFSTEVKFGVFIPCVMWQAESLVGFLSGFADLTPAVKNDYKYLIPFTLQQEFCHFSRIKEKKKKTINLLCKQGLDQGDQPDDLTPTITPCENLLGIKTDPLKAQHLALESCARKRGRVCFFKLDYIK